MFKIKSKKKSLRFEKHLDKRIVLTPSQIQGIMMFFQYFIPAFCVFVALRLIKYFFTLQVTGNLDIAFMIVSGLCISIMFFMGVLNLKIFYELFKAIKTTSPAPSENKPSDDLQASGVNEN